MTQDPESTPVPEAFMNGHGPGPTPAQRTAAAMEAIAADLPRYVQAFGSILGGLPQAIGQSVRTPQHLCAQCVTARITWENSHLTELKAAITDAMAAHGIPDGSPVPAGLDPAPFLPENLRPGGSQAMPSVNPAITTVSGTDCCAAHIPGVQGGRTLLIAQGSLSPSMLSQFAA